MFLTSHIIIFLIIMCQNYVFHDFTYKIIKINVLIREKHNVIITFAYTKIMRLI